MTRPSRAPNWLPGYETRSPTRTIYKAGTRDGMEQAISTLFDEFVRIFGSGKAVLFLHWLEKKRLPTLLKELGKPNK